MDIEWNQLKIREFSSDSAKASGCRSTPTVGPCVHFGGGSENLWSRAKHAALFTDLSCAIRTEELLFPRDMPILKRTNRNFEPSLQILPFALSGMMPAYSCNHTLDSSVAPKIIYWTAYGCIKFCNLVAYNCTHVSLTTVKSCFETILLQNLQAQHFQEAFSSLINCS